MDIIRRWHATSIAVFLLATACSEPQGPAAEVDVDVAADTDTATDVGETVACDPDACLSGTCVEDVCVVCPPGTEGAECDPCPSGHWDDDDDPTTACIPHGVCGASQVMTAPGSATRDVECDGCPAGTIDHDADPDTDCVVALVDVESSDSSICALDTRGHVTCWGYLETLPPADMPAITLLVSGDVGAYCGLHADGLTCWGGDNAAPDVALPVEAVTTGAATCALDATHAWHCGASAFDPTPVIDHYGGVRWLDVGETDLFLLDIEGRPHTWRFDETGRYATVGSFVESSGYTDPLEQRYERIFASAEKEHRSICGIEADGRVDCTLPSPDDLHAHEIDWGNFPGQQIACTVSLDGQPVCWARYLDLSFADELLAAPVLAVTSGSADLCRLDMQHDLECMTLGNPLYLHPWQATSVLQVDVQSHGGCALRASGEVACWRNDPIGICPSAPDLGHPLEVRSGHDHACAQLADETLRCWGDDTSEQSTVPPDLGRVIGFDVGYDLTCAVTPSHRLRCWGDTSGARALPDDLADIDSVSLAGLRACVVDTAGTVTCWGAEDTDAPEDLAPAISVAAGVSHTCALLADGTVACWGSNANGQCDVPQGLDNVVSIDADWGTSCALRSDGELVCWGRAPSPPADLGDVVSMSVGSVTTCAINTEDELRCWGGMEVAPPTWD